MLIYLRGLVVDFIVVIWVVIGATAQHRAAANAGYGIRLVLGSCVWFHKFGVAELGPLGVITLLCPQAAHMTIR
jgi:hypothetical protein